MRLAQTQGDQFQYLEKVKRKWIKFTNGVVRALWEEELKLRHEEIEKQIASRNTH